VFALQVGYNRDSLVNKTVSQSIFSLISSQPWT